MNSFHYLILIFFNFITFRLITVDDDEDISDDEEDEEKYFSAEEGDADDYFGENGEIGENDGNRVSSSREIREIVDNRDGFDENGAGRGIGKDGKEVKDGKEGIGGKDRARNSSFGEESMLTVVKNNLKRGMRGGVKNLKERERSEKEGEQGERGEGVWRGGRERGGGDSLSSSDNEYNRNAKNTVTKVTNIRQPPAQSLSFFVFFFLFFFRVFFSCLISCLFSLSGRSKASPLSIPSTTE